MDVVCTHCRALFFAGEKQFFCKNGKLCSVLMPKLLAFEDIPQVFKELYDGQSEHSNEFFEKIRILNSVFSFTSLGISSGLTRDQAIQINSSLGGYSLVIHGQTFHQISPLLPRSGTKRTCSQVLFFDSPWEELQRRGELCKSPVSDELLKLIQDTLHLYNELYKIYKPIGLEVINEQNAVSMVIVDDFRKIRIKKCDQKLYSRPSADDFAGLIADKGQSEYSRDICVQKHDCKLQCISESHPANDALAYTLIFVKGELGWSPKMKYLDVSPRKAKKDQSRDAANEDEPDRFHAEQQKHRPQADSDGEILNDCLPETKKITSKTRLATLTLYLFMNFFLHVRMETFNLLFKGKY